MQKQIQPSRISGSLKAPASKSAMQRACAAALIRSGTTVLHNPGISDDDQAALAIIGQLGASVTRQEDRIIIESMGLAPVADHIDCGESGLSVRMFTSLAAVSGKALRINGRGSLLKRPLGFFDTVLPLLGVRCSSQEGRLPLEVKGPLTPADIEVDGSLSSQFLTGLLMAYAAAGASDCTIRVRGLNSKPYIDLTLSIMSDFGLKLPQHKNYESFYFGPEAPPQKPGVLDHTVEGDWSGAAFLFVAAAVAGSITVRGLDVFSTQADRAVLQALMQSEAITSISQERIEIKRNRLRPFHFNATDCPDLFPPLVALAAYCGGTSVIEGAGRLAHKESNRALTLQEEFEKMGVSIRLQDDLMIVEGGNPVKGALVHSHGDHRIAMACAVAGMGAEGITTIDGAEAVNKSYPQFWEHMEQLSSIS
ncbi:MAG TPA: 3-phosphoshikimate 1-carboxyvinyltransferase [Flavisolibacter sp.]|nr:3-phosphoshikimate 1-carboxyvinyltransferase [Flavisolibacter sp.]